MIQRHQHQCPGAQFGIAPDVHARRVDAVDVDRAQEEMFPFPGFAEEWDAAALAHHAPAAVAANQIRICSQMRFFASPQAASDWLDDHPAGRVLTVDQMLELDTFTQFRDMFGPLLE